MPDELVKMFLEEVIDSISNLSDALSCILQYYCVAVEENKFIESKNYESKEEKCSSCTFENKMVFTFTSILNDNKIEKRFYEFLTKKGINVKIESNGVLDDISSET